MLKFYLWTVFIGLFIMLIHLVIWKSRYTFDTNHNKSITFPLHSYLLMLGICIIPLVNVIVSLVLIGEYEEGYDYYNNKCNKNVAEFTRYSTVYVKTVTPKWVETIIDFFNFEF